MKSFHIFRGNHTNKNVIVIFMFDFIFLLKGGKGEGNITKNYYHLMHFPFSMAESPPHHLQITALEQIMVCSYVVPSKCVLLQKIFCSYV